MPEKSTIKYMDFLKEISLLLVEENDIHVIVNRVISILSKDLNMQRAMISIYNRRSGEISINNAHGLNESELSRGLYQVGEGITGKVVETGIPYIIPNIADSKEFLDKTASRKGINKEKIAFICYPIKIGIEVIGTISADIENSSIQILDKYVSFISIVAAMISQTVHIHQILHEEKVLLEEENRRLHDELEYKQQPLNVVARSSIMKNIFSMVSRVAKSDTTILINGESGVGKEVVANSIHQESDRNHKPFIKFNCAALTESLIESELFGHEKGSFTGAIANKIGKFEQSDCGTIFLDEISEVSLVVQAKLLRVIQEKKFERVGGTQTIKVDTRIIAATNKNLLEQISLGKFREDLFYRLNTFPIHVPALRERITDIPLLANHFLKIFSLKMNKKIERISSAALDMLISYKWPGNVRELENCIERSVILCDDNVINSFHLPATIQGNDINANSEEKKGTLKDTLQKVESELITEALKNSKGNMAEAARELGLTERIMNLRVYKYKIDFKKFKNL